MPSLILHTLITGLKSRHGLMLENLALRYQLVVLQRNAKKLRRFRAGIESGISWLKRSFGLTRCTWKGFRSFKYYVLASVVAANLLTMARKKLATA